MLCCAHVVDNIGSRKCVGSRIAPTPPHRTAALSPDNGTDTARDTGSAARQARPQPDVSVASVASPRTRDGREPKNNTRSDTSSKPVTQTSRSSPNPTTRCGALIPPRHRRVTKLTDQGRFHVPTRSPPSGQRPARCCYAASSHASQHYGRDFPSARSDAAIGPSSSRAAHVSPRLASAIGRSGSRSVICGAKGDVHCLCCTGSRPRAWACATVARPA